MSAPMKMDDFQRLRNYLQADPTHPLDADIQEKFLQYIEVPINGLYDQSAAMDVLFHSLNRLRSPQKFEAMVPLHAAVEEKLPKSADKFRDRLGAMLKETDLALLDDMSSAARALCITAMTEKANSVADLQRLVQHVPGYLEHGFGQTGSSSVASAIVRLVFNPDAPDEWRESVNQRFVALWEFGPANMIGLDDQARKFLYRWDPVGWLDRLLKEGIPEDFRQRALLEWAAVAPPKVLRQRAGDWVQDSKQLIRLIKDGFAYAENARKHALLEIFLKKRRAGTQLKTLLELRGKHLHTPEDLAVFFRGLPPEDALAVLSDVTWLGGPIKEALEKDPARPQDLLQANPKSAEARHGFALLLKTYPEHLSRAAQMVSSWEWSDLKRSEDRLGRLMAEPAGLPILRAYVKHWVAASLSEKSTPATEKLFAHMNLHKISAEQLCQATDDDPGSLALLLDDMHVRCTGDHPGTPYTPTIKYLCDCSDHLTGGFALTAYRAARERDPDQPTTKLLGEVLLNGATREMDAMRMLSPDFSREDILGLWRDRMQHAGLGWAMA